MKKQPEEYVIPEFKYVNHHMLPNGEIDQVSLCIDCWDQILYTILANSHIDPINYFYGNINPEFYEYNGQCGLRRVEEDVNREFEIITVESCLGNNLLDEIRQSVSEDFPVAMITMFDMLPNYDWYQEGIEKGTHNGHSNLIVGYDKDNILVIDSPLVFVKNRDKTTDYNKTLHLIDNRYVLKALSVYSDLKKIKYIGDGNWRTLKKSDFPNKVKNMVHDFYESGTKGRAAIRHYIEVAQKETEGKLARLVYYDVHLIYSRHELLKKYIEKYENKDTRWVEALPFLERCIDDWFSLKMLLNRSDYMENYTFRKKERHMLCKILNDEDILMKALSDC